MADKSKTSTVTVHHDHCKPETWTAHDVLAFANFVRTGDLRHAAALARLGVQLVLSEHHVPKGGTLEQVGFALNGDTQSEIVTDDLSEIAEVGEIKEAARIYRGPMEYLVAFHTGDPETGDVDGTECEVLPTREKAEAFLASMLEPNTPA